MDVLIDVELQITTHIGTHVKVLCVSLYEIINKTDNGFETQLPRQWRIVFLPRKAVDNVQAADVLRNLADEIARL